MTERRIQEIKAEVTGKLFGEVNFILNRNGFVEVDQFPFEVGYDVTYYQPHCGIFTIKFDCESICQAIYHSA